MLDKRTLEQLFRRNYSEMIRLARVLLAGDGEVDGFVIVDEAFVVVV